MASYKEETNIKLHILRHMIIFFVAVLTWLLLTNAGMSTPESQLAPCATLMLECGCYIDPIPNPRDHSCDHISYCDAHSDTCSSTKENIKRIL